MRRWLLSLLPLGFLLSAGCGGSSDTGLALAEGNSKQALIYKTPS